MKLFFFVLILVPALSHAKCKTGIDLEKTQIKWTAFKTPKKVGVNGEFKKFKIISTHKEQIDETILNSTFEIDSSSVNTTNPDRDKKIVSFFFTQKGSPLLISGKVIKVGPDSVVVNLNIDGKTKEVIFKKEIAGTNLKLFGAIDVMDFALDSNLQAINEACKKLHEGKTWPDVLISIETVIINKCD